MAKKAEKLNPLALGYASAIVAALSMLLLGILGILGLYTGAVELMQKCHMFFSLSVVGIVAGMLEAAVMWFVCGYVFGWLYNRFA